MQETELKGKTVLISGASAGIGQACARAFAEVGARLILLARRAERLEAERQALAERYGCDVLVRALDVRDPQACRLVVEGLPGDWQNIDVLINNAGLSRGMEALYQGDLTDWDEMLDTNVKGLLYLTRLVVPGMLVRGRGHVLNIGSIAGHEVYPGGNVYCASKHAVHALSQGLRMDLVSTPIRVTEISPGLVETEFSVVRFHGDTERAEKVYQGMKPLSGEDVAACVLWAARQPAHVQINEVVVTPSAQASATVVSRT